MLNECLKVNPAGSLTISFSFENGVRNSVSINKKQTLGVTPNRTQCAQKQASITKH